MSTQDCPADGCGATYAPAILETTDRRCPQCDTAVVACPVCNRIVRLGVVWDTDHCPNCETHRLALGEAVRDAPDGPEVETP